jgi:hypothetical protein
LFGLLATYASPLAAANNPSTRAESAAPASLGLTATKARKTKA